MRAAMLAVAESPTVFNNAAIRAKAFSSCKLSYTSRSMSRTTQNISQFVPMMRQLFAKH
jgi:hypothetical protein